MRVLEFRNAGIAGKENFEKRSKVNAMQVQWLGHACMLLRGQSGPRVLTDPFDEGTGYRLPLLEVDIVTVSHDHFDHNAVQRVAGSPAVVKTAGRHEIKGVVIEGFPTYHDRVQGRQRGKNLFFVITMDGLRVGHCGDLGHLLEPTQAEAIMPLDVLLIPVGGVYTITAAEAYQVTQQLQPRVVIPMHYQTPHVSFTLEPVEKFTAQFPPAAVSSLPHSQPLEITQENLPKEMRVIVLDYPR